MIPAAAKSAVAELQHGQLVAVPGVGHVPHLEAPDTFREALMTRLEPNCGNLHALAVLRGGLFAQQAAKHSKRRQSFPIAVCHYLMEGTGGESRQLPMTWIGRSLPWWAVWFGQAGSYG